ncbi:MAG TPA: hypothetical protein PKE31_10560 [Pseudomonadota bacterium]|nr:hypothetical protein [Pseudomonadota bacterium]
MRSIPPKHSHSASFLFFSWLALSATCVASGCSGNTNTNTDMPPSAEPDLALPYTYKTATINLIDKDPGNGPFGNGERVMLDGVVAVSKVDKYVNSTNQQCRYQIWVQDPQCTTPPCGLVVKAIGPKAPKPDSTGKDCPSASDSGTLLNAIGRNDNVRLRGKILVELDSTPPMTVVEHQLFVEVIEILPQTKTIAPTVISDTTVFGQFVSHKGTTWNKYEGMLVTLQPPVGTLQIATVGNNGFTTTPGNTDWGNTFDSDYMPSGSTAFPTVGTTYKSISGVVSCRHGGEIMPGKNKDFVP